MHSLELKRSQTRDPHLGTYCVKIHLLILADHRSTSFFANSCPILGNFNS